MKCKPDKDMQGVMWVAALLAVPTFVLVFIIVYTASANDAYTYWPITGGNHIELPTYTAPLPEYTKQTLENLTRVEQTTDWLERNRPGTVAPRNVKNLKIPGVIWAVPMPMRAR